MNYHQFKGTPLRLKNIKFECLLRLPGEHKQKDMQKTNQKIYFGIH
jgi:hypothetical protein